jgi:uncharacterized protein (TIGR03437 family)
LRRAFIIAAVTAGTDIAWPQTLTTLYNFPNSVPPGGTNPYALAFGIDGNLYGTTQTGGAYGSGIVFRIAPNGSLATLFNFSNNPGGQGLPNSTLTVGPDGNLHGMTNAATSSVAAASGITIFEITPAGALTTLYTSSADTGGEYPGTGLALGPDGSFYGTTQLGGSSRSGTVFRIDQTGTFTTIYNFSGPDGVSPAATLTLGPDGNLYGTAKLGGAHNLGTVFEISPAGTLNTLFSFAGGTGGSFPTSALTLGSDGTFYGLANTVLFKLTPAGTVTTVYNFAGGSPNPGVALTLGTDGNFYGTIPSGGAYKYGTLFRVTPTGQLTTMYSFAGPDGAGPAATVVLGSDGNFYGTTQAGGIYNGGTVFRFSTAPFISPNGIVNAASYTAPVSAGSIASVFGGFAVAAPNSSTSFPIPTSLSGVSFQFDGAPLAPLFFASQNQFNVQIPWELTGQAQAAASASQGGQSSAPSVVRLATYAPGIFVMNSQTQQGAILDASYHLVSGANPATAGAAVQVYCTGLGPVTNQPATGAPAAADPLSWTTLMPTVMIGGASGNVLFSGLVPGSVGLYQVNTQIPAAAAKGAAVPLTISVGGVVSNTVYVAIQ